MEGRASDSQEHALGWSRDHVAYSDSVRTGSNPPSPAGLRLGLTSEIEGRAGLRGRAPEHWGFLIARHGFGPRLEMLSQTYDSGRQMQQLNQGLVDKSILHISSSYHS